MGVVTSGPIWAMGPLVTTVLCAVKTTDLPFPQINGMGWRIRMDLKVHLKLLCQKELLAELRGVHPVGDSAIQVSPRSGNWSAAIWYESMRGSFQAVSTRLLRNSGASRCKYSKAVSAAER